MKQQPTGGGVVFVAASTSPSATVFTSSEEGMIPGVPSGAAVRLPPLDVLEVLDVMPGEDFEESFATESLSGEKGTM